MSEPLEAFAEQVRREDDRIELARACLQIAEDAYPGLDVDGYVGEIGRTRVVGEPTSAQRELLGRCTSVLDRLIECCRPGSSAGDLLTVYEREDLAWPPMPIDQRSCRRTSPPARVRCMRKTSGPSRRIR